MDFNPDQVPAVVQAIIALVTALGAVVAAVTGLFNKKRIDAIEKKTDEQTAMLRSRR